MKTPSDAGRFLAAREAPSHEPVGFVHLGAAQALLAVFANDAADFASHPRMHRTTWVGNTFGSAGGPNGFGEYLVLLEEGGRGKDLLYRSTIDAK